MNALVRGNKNGFTLIELLVVMMLIGIMATVFMPNLLQLAPDYKRNEFVINLNSVLSIGWQNALKTGKAHRVFFDLDKNTARLEIDTGKQKAGQPVFDQVPAQFIKTSMNIPQALQFKQFYIEGEEKLRRTGIKTTAIWFYIAPGGLTQEVIINIMDTSQEDAEGNPIPFGLVINPFSAQLKDYDGFQKP